MSKLKNHIIYHELKSVLDYNSKTGEFTWLCSPGTNRVKFGDIAGCVNKKTGYYQIRVFRKQCYAHRLAWFWMTGKWPEDQIDHINLNKLDNSWNNLREANNTQNQANRVIRKDNTSGYKGVTFCKQTKKWMPRIQINNKTKHLGRFTTKEEAHLVYIKAADKYFGGFANYG